jgi:hypothetical protein
MVIFGTGVVTGGLLVRHSLGGPALRPARNSGGTRLVLPLSASGMRLDFLRRAERELELTPEQRERVDKIIKESQERTRKVMAPYVREELQRTKAEFREALTPEQRPRFDQLLKQQQEQQQRAREQRRPPPSAERPAETTPPSNTPPQTSP